MCVYIDFEFVEQILSLIVCKDYDIVLHASFCISTLVKIHPNAFEWAQSQTHLIFLQSINEWQNDPTLSNLTEKGLEIISLMADAEIQMSLVNHGIIDTLISITVKTHLLQFDIFVFISKIICNLSYCDIVNYDDDDDDDESMILETGISHSDMMNYMNLMALVNPCLQLGLDEEQEDEEQEDEEEEEEPNLILANSCKCIKNMIFVHGWPVMHDLPTKVWQQMISLLPCVDKQELRDDIIAILEGIIIKFSDDVDTLINEGKLFDELQKIDQPIIDVLRILSRLCSTNHVTQIIDDYPQLMTKIMDSLSSTNEIIIIKSMDCLNNLFQNNNYLLLFTKTNYTESLCTFLLKENSVGCLTEEYHQQYMALFTNTVNLLKNISDSNKNMSQNTQKLWKKFAFQ